MNHLHLPFSPATGFAAANVPWYTHIPPSPFVSDIWHHHLGHLSTDRLRVLLNKDAFRNFIFLILRHVLGVTYPNSPPNLFFLINRSTFAFGLIHFDFWRPIPISSC